MAAGRASLSAFCDLANNQQRLAGLPYGSAKVSAWLCRNLLHIGFVSDWWHGYRDAFSTIIIQPFSWWSKETCAMLLSWLPLWARSLCRFNWDRLDAQEIKGLNSFWQCWMTKPSIIQMLIFFSLLGFMLGGAVWSGALTAYLKTDLCYRAMREKLAWASSLVVPPDCSVAKREWFMIPKCVLGCMLKCKLGFFKTWGFKRSLWALFAGWICRNWAKTLLL